MNIHKFNALWSQYVLLLQDLHLSYLKSKSQKNKQDCFTIEMMYDLIHNYKESLNLTDIINSKLKYKKKRQGNFPSEISENMAKFALNRYNIFASWDTKPGDLAIGDIKLEVKGFVSNGPCSFGPTETWHSIIFVDARNIKKNKVKIYLVNLSNNHNIWQQIKVNKNETYQMHCISKRRPRLIFNDIIKQIPEEYIIRIYDGDIYDLNKS